MSRPVLSTIPAQIVAICVIAAATLLLPMATPVEARIATNGLSENRIALNRIALNKLATNRIATNRLAANRIATNKLAANRIATNKLAANRIAVNGVIAGAAPNPLMGLDRKPIAR